MKEWLSRFKTAGPWIALAAAAIAVYAIKAPAGDPGGLQAETSGPILSDASRETAEAEPVQEQQPIFVDVKGAVIRPGIYRAEEGERVHDLIIRAGGFSDAADERLVNLASRVTDEMVIYIPKAGEDSPAIADAAGERKDGMVNINKADEGELQTLPGIGPSKARAIIAYREEQGPFQKPEDVMKVSGIGGKTFERLQDSVSVK